MLCSIRFLQLHLCIDIITYGYGTRAAARQSGPAHPRLEHYRLKAYCSLLDGFLRQEGWSNVTRVPGKDPDEYSLQGVVSGSSVVQSIEVEAHGSGAAFDSLVKAACDIGMSSRKIKPAEQAMLTALGDMTSPARDHVLALDGSQTTDWSKVGGNPGHIDLFARDDRSGTYDTLEVPRPGEHSARGGSSCL